MGLSQMFSLVILVSFLHLPIGKVGYIVNFLTILTAAAASCESIRGVKLHSLHYSQTGRHLSNSLTVRDWQTRFHTMREQSLVCHNVIKAQSCILRLAEICF